MALRGCQGGESPQPASQPLRYQRYPRPTQRSLFPRIRNGYAARDNLLLAWWARRLPLACIAEGGDLVAVHAPSGIKAAGAVPRHRFDKLGSVAMQDLIVVREWDADSFHRRVLELESQGFKALRETYRISPEMDPESGTIIHLHTIEMSRPKA